MPLKFVLSRRWVCLVLFLLIVIIIIHGVIFAVPGIQSKCESCTFFTVKIKCAYHTNGVLYGTVGVLITILLG